ncbi:MAG: family transcriptional regulator, cyclic receptor protein, partial [Micromonosporaceae bacterium]|nr:family transcriptional regulator, cyclic receptor protein [Micromonosporaceae bacterium]
MAATDASTVTTGATGPPRIRLLEADPELARYVTQEELPRARRSVTAPLLILPEGQFEPLHSLGIGTNSFAALILSGLVSREITVGGQPTLRLLGPGDMVHSAPIEAGLLMPEQAFTASLPTRLAVLDDLFLHAVRHWPRLLTALVERTAEHHDATLIQLAISQQPRVEDRLVALFRALAERWGRVTAAGVVVPLSLTHEALGRLIGARRPTVTLALKALNAGERLRRRPDGSWLISDLGGRQLSEPLAPLTGAARPRLLASPEDALAHEPGTARHDLVAEVRWLKLTHETLRKRMEAVAAANEETRLHTRDLLEQSRANRQGRA